MRSEIIEYLDIALGPRELGPDRVMHLARALDRLVAAVWDVPEDNPDEDDITPPSLDHRHTYQTIAQRFPELKPYTWSDPVMRIKPFVGDPIDDAADIALDLSEALWLIDHQHGAEAHWHLAFHFRIHWGRHLFNLRSYLHALLNEA